MDSDIQILKKELAELKTLTQENNRMILGIYRRAKISMIVDVTKWVIIIGISIGAFYFVQPYIDSVVNTYSNLLGNNGADGQQKGITNFFKQF